MGEMIDTESTLKALRRSRFQIVTLQARIQGQRVELQGAERRDKSADGVEVVEIKRQNFNSCCRCDITRAGDDAVAPFRQPLGGDLANSRTCTCHHNDFHGLVRDSFHPGAKTSRRR